MANFILPARASKGRRPSGPLILNRDSPQAQGLIAWWPFGLYAGYDIVQKYSGTFNSVGLGAGLLGVGLTVSASTQRMTVLDRDVFDSTSALSLVAWAYLATTPSTDNTYRTVIKKDGNYLLRVCFGTSSELGSNAVGFSGLWWDNTNVTRFVTNAGPGITTGLHHYGLSVSGNAIAGLYADGLSQSNVQPAGWFGASRDLTKNLELGGASGANESWDGVVFDIRLYSSSLSAAQMWALYDPLTRWDLYWQPSPRTFFDIGASFNAATFPFGAPDTLVRAPVLIRPSGRVA